MKNISNQLIDNIIDRLFQNNNTETENTNPISFDKSDISLDKIESIYNDYLNKPVIIRAYSAGVFYGTLANVENDAVILNDSRRIWCWYGANSLSDIALYGVQDTKQTKICAPLKNHLIKEFIEILPLTDEALKNLNSVTNWSQSNG